MKARYVILFVVVFVLLLVIFAWSFTWGKEAEEEVGTLVYERMWNFYG